MDRRMEETESWIDPRLLAYDRNNCDAVATAATNVARSPPPGFATPIPPRQVSCQSPLIGESPPSAAERSDSDYPDPTRYGSWSPSSPRLPYFSMHEISAVPAAPAFPESNPATPPPDFARQDSPLTQLDSPTIRAREASSQGFSTSTPLDNPVVFVQPAQVGPQPFVPSKPLVAPRSVVAPQHPIAPQLVVAQSPVAPQPVVAIQSGAVPDISGRRPRRSEMGKYISGFCTVNGLAAITVPMQPTCDFCERNGKRCRVLVPGGDVARVFRHGNPTRCGSCYSTGHVKCDQCKPERD